MSCQHELLKWHCRPAIAKPLRYAGRLVSMGPVEIAGRLRGMDRRNRTRVSAWKPPRARALRKELEQQFLFGPARARRILESWRGQRPEQAERLVNLARAALERWEIFGVPVRLEPGAVNWRAGDPRWVWELNRHQFLFTFARAFVLTGDPAFAQRIVALIEDWRKRNPAGCGVNWSSALEVGVRAISWLWTLPLLLDWEGLEKSFLPRCVRSLAEHYQYLRRRLSVYTDPTNHLIGEAAALWLLSVALPGLPDGPRQERRALEILAREIGRQVTPDGADLEQSTGYQQFVLDFYLQVMAVARHAGRELPPVIGQRVEAMVNFLGALGGADGNLPALGDSDDGRGAPFPNSSDPEESAVWLEPPAVPAAGGGSRVFQQGGYCLWRADEDLALLFDVGPLGLWPNASHGHADALSVQVKIGGRWFLGDPGTGVYAASRHIRDTLRGTAAHNTVTVDELNQVDALDVFKWLKPVRARLLNSCCNKEYDFALGMHEGYHRLRHPVTHYRAVLFVRPPARNAGWIILDRLEGEGCHDCAARFHFVPGTELLEEGPHAAVALDPADGTGLRFVFSGPHLCEEGLWSRRFGEWEQAPVLAVRRRAELPLAFCAFLWPANVRVEAASVETACHGPAVFCRCGEATVEWIIEGTRHRFLYTRAGEQPGRFER